MLTNILMEAIMSMDDETLDYVLESCDNDEIEFLNDAIEATSALTASEQEKIEKITKIQADAREKGWGNVPAKDRTYYVNTVVKAGNDKDFLKKLKKAKQLGEREGAANSKLNKALSIFTKADAAINAVAGGVQGAATAGLVSGYDTASTIAGGVGGTIGGGVGGAINGAIISKIVKEADKIRRYERDKHEIYSQGGDMHPEDVWKSKTRKDLENKIETSATTLKDKIRQKLADVK